MTIHFEGVKERRKELVQALVDATGVKSEYLSVPSFAYKVGDFTVQKDGSMDVDDLIDRKELGITLQALRGRGFIPTDNDWNEPEEAPTEQEMLDCRTAQHEDGITLSFPKEGLSADAIANVKKLIAAKAPFIKQSLELDELPIEESEDRLTFAWLPFTAPAEMVNATSHLLAAIIKLSKKLKRVTATERETDNPRYAFRCFLLRLGFIGDEYKAVRKYLMHGIPGNGSKRHPTIEFDASVDTPSEDTSFDVDEIEKFEAEILTEEAIASDIVIPDVPTDTDE